MTNNITEPLRLAVGPHSAGSGKGCAMNLISWENGDTEITDLPGCSDKFLAQMVQGVNDSYCDHTDLDLLLCAACSVDVLALAHRTVGTYIDKSWLELNTLYSQLIPRNSGGAYGNGQIIGESGNLSEAHRIIDRFLELTGLDQSPTPPSSTVRAAYEKMVAA